MSAFPELTLLLTRFHPSLPLGNESLKEIRLTKSTKIDPFPNKQIFSIKTRTKTQESIHETPASPVTKPHVSVPVVKRSIKEILPVTSSLESIKSLSSGKKYKQTLIKLSEKAELPQKRPDCATCPICNWEFPLFYMESDMQKHANLCMNVKKNQDDIEKFDQTLKKKKKSESEDSEEDAEIIKIQEELEKTCPHCNLRIGKRSQEFQKRHIKECCTERNQPYAANKQIYQELGTIPKKTIDSCSKKLILRRSIYPASN